MSLKDLKEKQKNRLNEINLIDENVFSTNVDKKQREKKLLKPAGRPKKNETCNKKIIVYFTENEFNNIIEKAGSISVSPFLKKIILDNLK